MNDEEDIVQIAAQRSVIREVKYVNTAGWYRLSHQFLVILVIIFLLRGKCE